jgi:hypothetical protein
MEPENPDLPNLNPQIEEYVRPERELFQEAQHEISAFDSAFDLVPGEENQDRQNRRIYWKDIIAREEAKKEEEEQQLAE